MNEGLLLNLKYHTVYLSNWTNWTKLVIKPDQKFSFGYFFFMWIFLRIPAEEEVN